MTAFCLCRDDVIFHDHILTLLPLYWKRVPKDFELIFVGQVYPGGDQPVNAATGERSRAY